MTTRVFRWRWRSGSATVRVAGDSAECAGALKSICPSSIVLDVEPWLVHWTDAPEALEPAIEQWLVGYAGDAQVVVCTNSLRFENQKITIVPVLSGSMKPWTKLEELAELAALGANPVVVGDLLVTDGLLANRQGWDFVWMPWKQPAPGWPALLRFIDRLLARLVLAIPEREARQ